MPDLMAALEASLAAVKDKDGGDNGKAETKKSSSKSSGSKSSSKKEKAKA